MNDDEDDDEDEDDDAGLFHLSRKEERTCGRPAAGV